MGKLKEKVKEAKAAASKRFANYRESEAAKQDMDDLEVVAGAAGAGLASANGIEVEIDDTTALPAGLVAGAGLYAVGRLSGNRHMRKLGVGGVAGGLALLIDEQVGDGK